MRARVPAELVNLVSTALLVAAFILAIAGLFIAVSSSDEEGAAVSRW